ncbi:MAG: 50S ribosomal protein L5 [Alphaproteobacteria bacterium]|nr:MAG: 50S ribosomal protein L5 [Alphaproteobacteria bacterium]
MTHYETLYKSEIAPALRKDLKLENVHEIPKLEKIVLNMGVSEAVTDNKVLNSVQTELSKIAGQRAVITKAKNSIAGFKIREGMKLGCKVTLRRKHMYEFLERLVNIALPRVRDFRGLKNRSFDKQGNYSFGLKEHIVFPEVDYDTISKIRGMDITICMKSKAKEHSLALLKAFNFPIK